MPWQRELAEAAASRGLRERSEKIYVSQETELRVDLASAGEFVAVMGLARDYESPRKPKVGPLYLTQT